MEKGKAMKYLVVLPEVAYITRYDGKGVIDAWDAPEGKFFKPQAAKQLPEEMDTAEAFRGVEIIESILPK